jgi:HAD superfamily phosphoserine phosphatase-like hydrolase
MECNVYDFDKTIYNGDSSIDFYLFCLKKKPHIIKFLPLFIFYLINYKLHKVTKEQLKEKFFIFLNCFNNIDELVLEFWNSKENKIKKFYLDRKNDNDIIISASPEFLLKPICNKLNIKNLIASNVNKNNGKYKGKNCYGIEKVKRLKSKFKKLTINEVYSDSYSDIDLLKLGKKSYIVINDEINYIEKEKLDDKMKSNFWYKKIIGIWKIIFAISIPFTTLIYYENFEIKYIKYLFILSFICGIFLEFIFKKNINKKINYKILIFSFLFGMYGISKISIYSNVGITWFSNILEKYLNIGFSFNIVKSIVSILSIPSFISIIYILTDYICPFIKNEYKRFNKFEKVFLIIVSILAFCFTTIVYNKTSAFYSPTYNGKIIDYDVIYTTDTGNLTYTDVYLNNNAAENDIRQPLFGIFSTPFSLTSRFISNFFEFIPNSYYIIFSTIQILLLALIIIWIAKMIGFEKENEILFCITMLSTFSFILFSNVYEQYIISLFYLILTIYVWHFYKTDVNYSYIGAVGTLLTSGIIFPFITSTSIKDIKNWIKNIFKCFIGFVIICILSSKILIIKGVVDQFDNLMRFTGKGITFGNKFIMFTHFVSSIFVAPKGEILNYEFPSYRLSYFNSISILGIIILILCIISFIINRKNTFAKISISWIIFSFIILCVIGWGTKENGAILYSLYFFWPYVSLLCLLINKIKKKNIKIFIYVLLIIIMLYFNFTRLIEILHFAFRYYYL